MFELNKDTVWCVTSGEPVTNSSIFCSYFENSISKNLFRFLAVPDIEAKKGGLKRICEVVTEEMFKGDKQKYIELKNYCDEYDFHFYIIDKDGKRRQIDPETFGKNNLSF